MGNIQLLVYANDINMLGKNLQTAREYTKVFIKANKDLCLQVNSEKTKTLATKMQNKFKYRLVFADFSFENVQKFKYFGITLTIEMALANILNAE